MQKSRIPSPARSKGALTPRRLRPQRTRSVGSPARSTASGRLSSIVDQFKENNKDSFALSPLSKTVLSNDTDIEMPRRQSWWRKVDHSRDVIDILDNEKPADPVNVLDEFDVEVLTQEKKNYTMDLPDSSGSESISSIVVPQRKLFTQKESLPQKKFAQVIGTRESLAKHNKTNVEDETEMGGTKNLFGQPSKRPKPVFPVALLNISADKTFANKTKELATEVKGHPRNLFGNAIGTKRKNIFADFIVSESEDEISEIQPKVFAFNKKSEPRRSSTVSRGMRDPSPTSSITTDIEMDDWKLLPSSTMVEHQLEANLVTPGKRARLSKLSEAKESTATNSTKQSIKSVSSKNKSKTLSSPTRNEVDKSLQKGQTEPVNKTQEVTRNATQNKSKVNASAINNASAQNVNDIDVKESSNVKNRTYAINKTANKIQNENVETNLEIGIEPEEQIETKQQPVAHPSNPQEEEEEDEDIPLTYEDNEAEEMIQEKELDISAKNESKTVSENEQSEYTKLVNSLEKQIADIVGEGTEHIVQTATPEQDKSVHVANKVVEETADSQAIEDEQTKQNADIEVSQKEIETDLQLQSEKVVERETSAKEEFKTSFQNNDKADTAQEELETSTQNNDKADIAQEELETSTQNNDKADTTQEELETSIQNNDKANDNGEVVTDDDQNKELEASDDQQDEESDQVQAEDSDQEQAEATDQNKAELSEERTEAEQELDADEEEQEQIELEIEEDEEIEDNNDNMDVDEQEHEISKDEDEEQIEEIEHASNDEAQSDLEVEDDNQNVSQEEDDDQNGSQEEVNDQNESQIAVDDQNESEEEVDDQNESEEEVDDQNVSQEEVDDRNESQEEIDDQNESHDDEQNISQEMPEEEEKEESEELEQSQEQEENKLQTEPHQTEVDTETNVTHDTTGRYRQKRHTDSPEAILHDMTNEMDSFTAKGRNTSVRKTSIHKKFSIKPSLVPQRESTRLSDGTNNSSAEGSGWDSHRTTRKTLRQTFGKDFTPRKSLRALVMEKSAKRQTQINEANAQMKLHQANSTEMEPVDNHDAEMDYEDPEPVESDHELSRTMRQAKLEMYLQKMQKEIVERKLKIEEQVKSSLKSNPIHSDVLNFRVPSKPAIRRANTISLQAAPKMKRKKPSVIALEDLPPELIEDMKYKPPKRFRPSNASWITKRLYKFLESKLEPKYDYKARVRAEKLVETIYNFSREARKNTYKVAPLHSVTELKKEMARLNIVHTHFEFYNFFNEYMPYEIKIKVVPDIVNDIPIPREGIFAPILEVNDN